MDSFFDQIASEMTETRPESFPEKVQTQEKKIKKYGDNITAETFQAKPDNAAKEKKKDKARRVREYVDLSLDDQEKTEQLEQLVAALILRLKQLYFNKKTKVPKGKPRRMDEPVKKRYIVGMHEVAKNLKIGQLKMLIIATDLEKVDIERGTDEVVNTLVQTCRRMQVPLVFAYDRYRLGCLAKYQGQKVSCIGVCNF